MKQDIHQTSSIHWSEWPGELPWLKCTWIYSLKLWNGASTISGIPTASSTGQMILRHGFGSGYEPEEPGQFILWTQTFLIKLC